MESKLKAKEFPKLPEPPFVYLSDDEKIIKNMRDELEKLNQQTPITPESLEGIGFVYADCEKENMQFSINNFIGNMWIQYDILPKRFRIRTDGSEVGQYLHFTSTEQITEWVKPFQSGVAEEVR